MYFSIYTTVNCQHPCSQIEVAVCLAAMMSLAKWRHRADKNEDIPCPCNSNVITNNSDLRLRHGCFLLDIHIYQIQNLFPVTFIYNTFFRGLLSLLYVWM